jgi:hypothetical protein
VVTFVSTAAQLAKLLSVCDQLPDPRHLVCFEEPPGRGQGVMTLTELEARGAPALDAELERRLGALTQVPGADLALDRAADSQ